MNPFLEKAQTPLSFFNIKKVPDFLTGAFLIICILLHIADPQG